MCGGAAAEPFHVLAERNGENILIVLANGQVPQINLAEADFSKGGFHVGGAVPGALIYRDA